MEKDKIIMTILPATLHRRLKIKAATTRKTMNLLIIEALRDSFSK